MSWIGISASTSTLKNFLRRCSNFRKLLQNFLEEFQKKRRDGVLLKCTCRPYWKFSIIFFSAVFSKESNNACFCKKGSPKLTLSQEFSWIWKMRKAGGCSFWHAIHQERTACWAFKLGWGFAFNNVANCRFLEITRGTTFQNIAMQVIDFSTEHYNAEISPITLLKNDSSREALLAILKNQEIFLVESVISVIIDSKLDSSNYLKGALSTKNVFLRIFRNFFQTSPEK